MPSSDLLLLRVAATWFLPGLGVLVVPAGATPRLANYPLHTALGVVAEVAGGTLAPATATVEEITREGTTNWALLLDFGRLARPRCCPVPTSGWWKKRLNK
jgi:hypothetical protein